MNYFQKKKLAFMSIVNRVKGFVRTITGVLPLTLEGCVDDESIIDYTLYGQSVQNGTPTPETPVEVESVGEKTRNIWYPSVDALTSNGITCTRNNDNTYTVNGTATADFYFHIGKITIEVGTTYYLSGGTSQAPIAFQLREGSTGVTTLYNCGGITTFSPTGEHSIDIINCVIAVRSGVEVNNVIVKPMISLENTDEYEPYGYKIPIKVSGKNLFDIESATSVSSNGWNKVIVNYTDQTINCNYPIDYDGVTVPCNTEMLEVGTYTLSVLAYIPETAPSSRCYLAAHIGDNKIGKYYKLEKEVWTRINVSFTVKEQTVFHGIRFQPHSGTWNSNSPRIVAKNVQIEKSDTATDYEPYHEPITTNIYLDEPLRKVGNYADYVDLENGKVVRNVKGVRLNKCTGTYTWIGKKGVTFNSALDKNYDHRKGLCNRNSRWTANGDEPITMWLGVNSTVIYWIGILDYLGFTTVTEFNEWLMNNPTYVFYGTDLPTETPITLPPIPTFKGTSIVSADTTIQPSNAEVTYYSTIKGVI